MRPQVGEHCVKDTKEERALTRYLSILSLNILTLLACTQSVDKLFHTLMTLCEKEYFLTSNQAELSAVFDTIDQCHVSYCLCYRRRLVCMPRHCPG